MNTRISKAIKKLVVLISLQMSVSLAAAVGPTETFGENEVGSYLEKTFSWVDEMHHLAGSSCPALNTSMGVDAQFLKTRVKAVISLNDAELDWTPLIQEGIQHIAIKVPDYRAPTVEQMQTIVEFINRIGPNEPILVHCNAGMGRTGTVLASILVWKYGLSADEAIRIVRAKRRGSVQTFKQEDGVKAWAEFLYPSH